MPKPPKPPKRVTLVLPDGTEIPDVEVVDDPPGEGNLTVAYDCGDGRTTLMAFEDDGTAPDGLAKWRKASGG